MVRGDEIDKLSTLEVRTKEPLVKDPVASRGGKVDLKCKELSSRYALWGDGISWLQVANRPPCPNPILRVTRKKIKN